MFFQANVNMYFTRIQVKQAIHLLWHDPRGRSVKYNLDEGNEEVTQEEEDDDEERDQHDLHDHDDP